MNPDLPKDRPVSPAKLPFPRVMLLLFFLILLLSLTATVYLITSRKNLEPPTHASVVPGQETTVRLKTKSKNPFIPETQYVNPFDPIKSPLYSLKKP